MSIIYLYLVVVIVPTFLYNSDSSKYRTLITSLIFFDAITNLSFECRLNPLSE